MTDTVTVVDYDCGNLFSIRHALEHCGVSVTFSDDPDVIAEAESLILPGVGAFGDAMAKLEERNLIESVKNVAASGRPFLGICVGMQIMFDVGEEFGEQEGLCLIPGRVARIDDTTDAGTARRIPHIGWSTVTPTSDGVWADGILPNDGTSFDAYFLHSFQCLPEQEADLIAVTEYDGASVTAAVRSLNCWGCQFHPEKSGRAGLEVLRKFIALGPSR